jgi:hypothetical protein
VNHLKFLIGPESHLRTNLVGVHDVRMHHLQSQRDIVGVPVPLKLQAILENKDAAKVLAFARA